MSTEITWTVLPNGRANGRVRATLLVTPRLAGAATLASFPALADWPAQLVDAAGNWRAGFSLRFSAAGAPVNARPLVEPAGPRKTYRPDAALWRALLPPDTPVGGFEFKDLSARRIHSFPVRNILSFIDQRYRTTAVESPIEPPKTLDLIRDNKLRDISLFKAVEVRDEAGGEILFAPGLADRNYTRLAEDESRRSGRRIEPKELLMRDVRLHVETETDRLFQAPDGTRLKAVPARAPVLRDDFMQLKRFNLPRATRPLAERVTPPRLDFHQLIAAYGQHPALMRLLGLAIDVELDAPPPAASGTVWVEVQPAALATRSVRTHYQFDARADDPLAFRARPKAGSDISACCLALNGEGYQLVHLDVGGAGEKAMEFAAQVQRFSSRRSTVTRERAGLPSLQTAGVSLVRSGRAEFSAQLFVAQRVLNDRFKASQELEVWADDLVRGYRIDVLDGTSGRWRSLCRRRTTYSRTDNGASWFEDYEGNDGWISLAVTESTVDGDDDLQLQESLFRWTGWSLVASRPGNTLSADYRSVRADGQETSQPLNLRITTVPSPGSLPRLRFGAPYRVRARVVDLAGNGLTLDEADRLVASAHGSHLVIGDGYVYRRFEPLAQPVVLAHDPLAASPGETIERMVIRRYNHGPELDAAPTRETSRRHLAPSGQSQLMAEGFGGFDGPDGRPQPARYQDIVRHDEPLPNADGVYHQPSVPLTYLPDPAVRGAAFSALPAAGAAANQVVEYRADGAERKWQFSAPGGEPRRVHQVDFGPARQWPDLSTFRLRLSGTDADRDPAWDARERELTVFIKPGETRTVRLSAYPAEADLEKFEAWGWLKEAGRAEALKGQVLAGLHWMLTPHRELTLVHAVQQPLLTPAFRSLWARRDEGDTFAVLGDSFPIDGHSTLKIDIDAAWRDVDDTGPHPVWVDGRDHAFELPVEYDDTEVKFGPQRVIRHLLVNPRRLGLLAPAPVPGSLAPAAKAVTRPGVRLEQQAPAASAVTRPGLELEQQEAVTRAAPGLSLRAGALSQLSREQGVSAANLHMLRPIAVAGVPLRVFETGIASRHEFGDTRYRRVSYTATATTRYLDYMPFYAEFREFLRRSVDGSGDDQSSDAVRSWEKANPKQAFTRRSAPVTIDVPSSARPRAPEIEYVIPTFGWQRDGSGSRRLGGGLRVYLRRPWFSSGAGELLGVVVGQPPAAAASNLSIARLAPQSAQLGAYITQWGMDPLHAGAPVPSDWTPRLEHFRNAYRTESNLTLDEVPGARVSVAGYVVGWWGEDGSLTGYDEARQLWYCDILIDPGRAFFPFVRLALARYQPNSISWGGEQSGDVKLSRVVLADFAQLAPDRFASITHKSDTLVRVSVSGFTHGDPAAAPVTGAAVNPTMMRTPQAADLTRAPGAVTSTLNAPALSGALRPLFPESGEGTTMEVTLESAAGAGDDQFGWTQVPDARVKLARIAQQNAWHGELRLTEPRGPGRHRLVFREYEWFDADPPAQPAGRLAPLFPRVPRLVYVDTLEL